MPPLARTFTTFLFLKPSASENSRLEFPAKTHIGRVRVNFQTSGHHQGAQAARTSAGDPGSQISVVAMLAAEPVRDTQRGPDWFLVPTRNFSKAWQRLRACLNKDASGVDRAQGRQGRGPQFLLRARMLVG